MGTTVHLNNDTSRNYIEVHNPYMYYERDCTSNDASHNYIEVCDPYTHYQLSSNGCNSASNE